MENDEGFVRELKRLLAQWKVRQVRHTDKARSDPTERLWGGIALATKACRADLERLVERLESGNNRQGAISLAEAAEQAVSRTRTATEQGAPV